MFVILLAAVSMALRAEIEKTGADFKESGLFEKFGMGSFNGYLSLEELDGLK